ncbi:MAG: potassium channel family protein, partial [Pseudomonadota bacterium]
MTGKKRLWLIIPGLIIYVGLLFLLVFLERGGEKANIKNLPDAVWYSLVTLTTVGYGDFFPTTTAGRLVGFLFLLGSVGLLGLLVSRLTDSLATAKERRKMGFN